MSDFNEYPKALYSAAGKFAVAATRDAEEAQWIEWGETAPEDAQELPNPLAVKVDQDPMDSAGAQHQGVEATMDGSAAQVAAEPTAEPQA